MENDCPEKSIQQIPLELIRVSSRLKKRVKLDF